MNQPPETPGEIDGPQWRRAIVGDKQVRLWADPESGGVLIEVLDSGPVQVGRVEGLNDYERRAELKLEEAWEAWGTAHEDGLWSVALSAYNDEEAAYGHLDQ